MSLFETAAVLFAIAAAIAYLNYRFARLPSAVAVLVGGLVSGMAILAVDRLWPHAGVGTRVVGLLADVDFSSLLMNGMLGFLLFAGSLTVDVHRLRENLRPVLTLARAGVLLSTPILLCPTPWLFALP